MQETFSNFHVSSSGTSPGRVGGGGRSIGGAVAAPPPLRLTIFNCHASNAITLSLAKNSTRLREKRYNRLNYQMPSLCVSLFVRIHESSNKLLSDNLRGNLTKRILYRPPSTVLVVSQRNEDDFTATPSSALFRLPSFSVLPSAFSSPPSSIN